MTSLPGPLPLVGDPAWLATQPGGPPAAVPTQTAERPFAAVLKALQVVAADDANIAEPKPVTAAEVNAASLALWAAMFAGLPLVPPAAETAAPPAAGLTAGATGIVPMAGPSVAADGMDAAWAGLPFAVAVPETGLAVGVRPGPETIVAPGGAAQLAEATALAANTAAELPAATASPALDSRPGPEALTALRGETQAIPETGGQPTSTVDGLAAVAAGSTAGQTTGAQAQHAQRAQGADEQVEALQPGGPKAARGTGEHRRLAADAAGADLGIPGAVAVSTTSAAPAGAGLVAEAAGLAPDATRAELTAAQIRVGIGRLVRSGHNQLQLELHPAELGRIDLRLTSDTAGLQIVMTADQPSTAALLDQQLAHLRQSLADAGINLAGLSVGAGGANGHPSMPMERGLAGSTGGSTPDTPAAPEPPSARPSWVEAGTQVDYLA
jgi:flagellar hook-length control protein FliK